MPEYQPQQKQKQTMIKPKPEYHAKAFEKEMKEAMRNALEWKHSPRNTKKVEAFTHSRNQTRKSKGPNESPYVWWWKIWKEGGGISSDDETILQRGREEND